jgi:hypothetical protein
MRALRWALVKLRRVRLPDQTTRLRCACLIAVVRGACEVDGWARAFGGAAALLQVVADLSALAMVRKMAASGQAHANATRMRVAVSMTRAATLSNPRRRVANSAVFGFPLDAPHEPERGGVKDQKNLVGVGRAARGAVAGKLRLYSLIRFSARPRESTKLLARMTDPLIRPNPNDHDGYVPNVLYSCGALVHQRTLLLPYAIADSFTTFASVPLDRLLAAMA